MAHDRLLELLLQFDPEQIEKVFGREFVLKPPDPTVALAPVKRVAIITEAFLPKIDGVSKTAFLTLNYLKQTGREVLVFAPDISPDHIGDTRIIPLPSIGVFNVPETRMALPNPIIARELHAFKPDLIHMFSPALMSVSGMATGRHMNVPIVANYQTDLPGYAKHYGVTFASELAHNWLRYVHNGCHLTLVPSKHTTRDLRDHGYKRLRYWGRGVDGERFNPNHRTQAMRDLLLNGRDPNSLLCVYVGRLATEKCVDLLLGVAHLEGVSLTIVGDGAQRSELEALFAGTNTFFTGYLLGDELATAYASADVFLFTGPQETFGQVVQEAMASGLPTVVTNQGGVKDLVVEGESGFVVRSDTREAFADAVRCLRDDPALRLHMSTQARAIAESRPWEKVLAQLEDYYREALRINDRFVRIYGHTDYHTNPARIAGALVGFE
ncbi:MAG: glycosyltransferase family 1 protein [Anaerolineae bacterium]